MKIGGGFVFLFDSRWNGSHGIGRFSIEVGTRLEKYFVKGRFANGKPSSPYDFLYLTFKLYSCKYNYFSPGYSCPFFFHNARVITIHDLNHLDFPDNSSFLKKLYYKMILKRLVKKVDYVLTVSNFSKKRIADWAGICVSKIVNVGNGVDESFSPLSNHYAPGFPYILCISNRRPHKNEVRLIQAFVNASIPTSIKLIFSGNPSDYIMQCIISHRVSNRVVFMGNIDEDLLASLYRGALGLVFPSLYEGFGLPVVEAMASGIPVLTSNTTSLPEVAGDAALLVNPKSVDEIRAGIERLVHDEALRSELIAKGLERAKLFSWDEVAARVQAVLDEVTSQYEK